MARLGAETELCVMSRPVSARDVVPSNSYFRIPNSGFL